MIGLAIGLACGFTEFYLLTKLTAAFTSGSSNAVFYVLAKVVLLSVTLGAGVLFVRDQLVYLGIGVAAPLLICSVAFYFWTNLKMAHPNPKCSLKENSDGDKIEKP